MRGFVGMGKAAQEVVTIVLPLALLGLALTNLIVGTVLIFCGLLAGAGVAFTAGTVLLLLSRLDQIETFKAYGVEMRRLTGKLNEADEMLGQLKALSITVGGLAANLASRQGWFSGPMPSDELAAYVESIRRCMERAGATDEEVQRALSEWKIRAHIILTLNACKRVEEVGHAALEAEHGGGVAYRDARQAFDEKLHRVKHAGAATEVATRQQALRQLPDSLTEISEAKREELVRLLAPYIAEIDIIEANARPRDLGLFRLD
ncbi:hypothetical protein [Chitiniphilus eburneus]|uniref:hypothetical protein n=1 Tax=Chitiniphilus eburneus TaxID=2571148 RepID=UPI0035CEBF35